MFDLEVVLSLFDGASMGQEALKRAGITYRQYLASEIDKPAMRVAMRNHPYTTQLGDIRNLKGENLPPIDLLMGGSPCQGFSYANTSKDKKKLAFDHPQSQLFFEFIRLVEETKPTFVFLENVRMKTEWRDEITNILSEVRGYRIEPVLWDSALVSAQRRLRNYWTDIPGFVIPEDRGILLKDVLEDEVDFKLYAGKELQDGYEGGNQLNPNYRSQANTIHRDKSATLCAGTHGYANGYVEQDLTLSDKRQETIKKNLGNKLDKEHLVIGSSQKNAYIGTDKCSTLTSSMGTGGGNTPMIKVDLPETKDASDYSPVKKKNYVQFDKSGKGFNSQQDRYFFRDNKSGTVSTKGNGNVEVK